MSAAGGRASVVIEVDERGRVIERDGRVSGCKLNASNWLGEIMSVTQRERERERERELKNISL